MSSLIKLIIIPYETICSPVAGLAMLNFMLESSAVLYCEYKRFDELKSESLVSQIAQSNTSGGSVTVLFEACADPGTCRGTIQHQMQILLLLRIIL